MINYLSKSIIPIILLIIITYGMLKERKVYEWFIEGAKRRSWCSDENLPIYFSNDNSCTDF